MIFYFVIGFFVLLLIRSLARLPPLPPPDLRDLFWERPHPDD